MNIKYYNIAHKSDFSSLDMSVDDLKVVIIRKNKSENSDSVALIHNILKSINAQDSKHHAILSLREYAHHSDALIDVDHEILVLAMDISPIQIGWQVNHHAYEVIQIRNIKLIFTHSLEELSTNKEHKISLWSILKSYT